MWRKTTLYYLAGILDGEGCVKVYNAHIKNKKVCYQARCEVSNTSKKLIDWLYKKFGGYNFPVKREGNRKLQYRWRLRNGEMREILPLVIPYMKVKKEEAIGSLNLLNGKVSNASI